MVQLTEYLCATPKIRGSIGKEDCHENRIKLTINFDEDRIEKKRRYRFSEEKKKRSTGYGEK